MRWRIVIGLLIGYLAALLVQFLLTGTIDWSQAFGMMVGGVVGVWVASRFFKGRA
jgi:uncharacterized membrane protein YfcA